MIEHQPTIFVHDLIAIGSGEHMLTSGEIVGDMPRRGTPRTSGSVPTEGVRVFTERRVIGQAPDLPIDEAQFTAMAETLRRAAQSLERAAFLVGIDPARPTLPPLAIGGLAAAALVRAGISYTPDAERPFRTDLTDRMLAVLTDSSAAARSLRALEDLHFPQPPRHTSPRRAARRRHRRALKRR